MKKLQVILLLLIVGRAITLASNEPVVLEAETAMAGSGYSCITEGAVTYAHPKTTNANNSPGTLSNVLTFTVTFSESGTYELYARLRVGTGNYGDDSFFFGKTFGMLNATNADSWVIVNGIVPNGYDIDNDIVGAQGLAGIQTWKWLNISEYINNDTPHTLAVPNAPSTYTFQIGSREDGLDIDKIAFCRAEYQYTVRNLNLSEPGSDPSRYYQYQETYVNPVCPGDHPDPSLLQVGDDFYASGSSFHFNPFSPILHSKDLVHWDNIARVVPSNWGGLSSASPSAGVWGGTLSYFINSFWYYFSNTAGGGQYFCKALTPAGPWSVPVKVKTTAETGYIGYDNSIFVDDDGTPYMLIKAGQFVNRIQQIGPDGHLTGSVINLDWVNTGKKYSWAEGPVMCKRNGWYYYFVAGNVYGGQYVLRSRALTSDSLSWEALGNFFETVSDPSAPFRNPNHITQPFMLSDSTWWTLSHSYENLGTDNWDGKGRQGLLHQIVWNTDGKPVGKAATTTPIVKPALTGTGVWRLPRSDSFDQETLKVHWHFLHPSSSTTYSLSNKSGWLALMPGTDSCHILQKDAGHFYTVVTKVLFHAQNNGQMAGLYLTNGNESKTVRLSVGFENGPSISFSFLTTRYQVPNNLGDTVWLRLERIDHLLYASYGVDGLNWNSLGKAIDVQEMDKTQDHYNFWVGNCQGLFAKGATAWFDDYAWRDGFSELHLAGMENYYGIKTVSNSIGKILTNTSSLGGWFMLGGVQTGRPENPASRVSVTASALLGGTLEIWLDDLERNGIKLGEINIRPTGSLDTLKTFSTYIPVTSGQHDVFFRYKGSANAFYLNTVRFAPKQTTTQ
jgi:xylan 1,4-beta-xylosidase